MQVLLDGQTLEHCVAESVNEAIGNAADTAREKGRLIVEVVVDGTPWEESQIQDELAGSTMKAEIVSLTSRDPRQLVISVFEDSMEALLEADTLQQSAAELMQANQIPEAMEKLNEALEIWQSVQKGVLMGAQVAEIQLDNQQVFEDRVTGAIERLNTNFTIIRDGLQSDDPIGISDTLLYEMPEVIKDWRDLLNELRQHVSGE